MTSLFSALLLLSSQPVAPPSITPLPTLPKDSKPTYRALSSPTCEHWRAARAGQGEDSRLRLAVYRMWVLGYVTGFNVVGPDPTGDLLGTAPREELHEAIDGYCARNPSSLVVDAMFPIASAYIKRRQGSLAATTPTPPAKRHATVVATVRCRDWADNRGNPILRLAYVGVLHGYVTAHNRFGPDPAGDAIGAENIPLAEGVVDQWCSGRPSALLIGAVAPLIDHVAAERAAGRLPPAGMRPQDKISPGSPKGR